MDYLSSEHNSDWAEEGRDSPLIIIPEVVAAIAPDTPPPARRTRRRWRGPLVLFGLTWLTTFWAGQMRAYEVLGWSAWMYAVPLMTILICHEAGHFIQALRYRVYASFPYFIPIPTPIGTLGAVIGMEAGVGDRRAVFDIGISGPLAGLVPTLIFCVLGMRWSVLVPRSPHDPSLVLPVLFQAMSDWIGGTVPPGFMVLYHPMAFAGWVGLLITAINLFPIGQLDGGHILYGLLRRRAHGVAWLLLVAAAGSIFFAAFAWRHYELLGWLVMLTLLLGMGPRHPPTANDYVPLGRWRTVLGWLTLAFVPLGFTPMPFLP